MADCIENGCVESGCIEGSGFVLPDFDNNPKISFYLSKGEMSEENLIAQIKDVITGEDRIGIAFVPESRKISLVTENGAISFLGQSEEVENRITQLEQRITNILSGCINVAVQMKAPDGTIIANPTVVKDGATFTFDVPDEVAGAEYSVVLSVGEFMSCEEA